MHCCQGSYGTSRIDVKSNLYSFRYGQLLEFMRRLLCAPVRCITKIDKLGCCKSKDRFVVCWNRQLFLVSNYPFKLTCADHFVGGFFVFQIIFHIFAHHHSGRYYRIPLLYVGDFEEKKRYEPTRFSNGCVLRVHAPEFCSWGNS